MVAQAKGWYVTEHNLIGSVEWQTRRTRDPAVEIRRIYENLREFACLDRTTGHAENATGKMLSVAFTNYAELRDAMRRAKVTTGEYCAFMLCVVGYTAVGTRTYPMSVWLPDGPLSYEEYAHEFDMHPVVVSEKVASACKKLAALIYDAAA